MVDGRGFVAEMGVIRPFQPHSWKHFLSRAGSGRGVHRPYWKGAICATVESGRGCNGPVGKVHFAPPRRSRGRRAGSGPGRVGVGPGQSVGVEVGGGNGGRGIRRSGGATAMAVETGLRRRVRVSATGVSAATVPQGRCPTLSSPRLMAAGERGPAAAHGPGAPVGGPGRGC